VHRQEPAPAKAGGKAHKPYAFGVKVSVATPLQRCWGGQFVAHVQAMPGAPYDGHTLATVIPAIEPVIGHLKNEHRMIRNHLAGSHGDAANAVLAVVGDKFRLLLRWLKLLRAILIAIIAVPVRPRQPMAPSFHHRVVPR